MKVAIAFRNANSYSSKCGRFTILRDDWQNPMLLYPDAAAMMKDHLAGCGATTIRFIKADFAEKINAKHFRNLSQKYGFR